MIDAVVFDIGETLLDDTREWNAWADWLGVRRHTFSAVVGAVGASGRDNREAFAYFRHDFNLEHERAAREAAGCGQAIDEADLYVDVRPALSALRDAGVWVGIAGNQTARVGELLHSLRLPADAIATSARWGSESLTLPSSTEWCPWHQPTAPVCCMSATTATMTCSLVATRVSEPR
ncbi:hypothetical protein GCM10027610_105850 [Dactylosporangium cerinum]